MKPYQHHHGRQSLDEYMSYLPKPIRKLALEHRTKDWAFIHVYSTDQAVLQIIDKSGKMSPKEIEFWTQVYRYYLGKAPIPSVSECPPPPKPEKDKKATPDMTDASLARLLFEQHPRGLSTEDVHRLFREAGRERSHTKIRNLVNYCRRAGDIEFKKYLEKPSYHAKKLYVWKDM